MKVLWIALAAIVLGGGVYAGVRFGVRDGNSDFVDLTAKKVGTAMDTIRNRAKADEKAGAKTKQATAELVQIADALAKFESDTGRFPTTEEGLKSLISNPLIPGWRGPYVKSFADPWGNPYRYQCPYKVYGPHYDMWTLGSDNREGGTGDAKDIEGGD